MVKNGHLLLREERKRKAREKRIYKRLLLHMITPAVCLLLIVGIAVIFVKMAGVSEKETADNVEGAVCESIPAYLSLSGSYNAMQSNIPEMTEEEKETLLLMVSDDVNELEQQIYQNGAFRDTFIVDGISGPTCVNIRSEGSITAEILGKLYVGAGGTIEKYDREWCYVKSGSVTGYVSTDYILTGDALEIEMLIDEMLTVVPKSTDEEILIYSEMDAESTKLGTMTGEMNVRSVSKYYIGVALENGMGYVLRSKVEEKIPEYINAVSIEEEMQSKSISASIAEAESIAESKKAEAEFASLFKKTNDTVYAIENVNIRASYSENSKIIGYLFVGDDVKRTAKGSNGWDQVEYYGEVAYVANAYISTKDPIQTTAPPKTTEQKTTKKTEQGTTKKTEQSTTKASITQGKATSLTEDEILMLAAMVYCEAGGESKQAQLAVANVILNRLRSGHWGNTLESVLSARGQFSPYASGRYAKVLASGPSKSAIEAAKSAAKGNMAIPSNYMFFCGASGYSYRYSNYKQIDSIMFYGR